MRRIGAAIAAAALAMHYHTIKTPAQAGVFACNAGSCGKMRLPDNGRTTHLTGQDRLTMAS
jgi:hypothetical protein